MVYDLLIKNGNIVTPELVYKADIAVCDGVIVEIGDGGLAGKAKRVIDAKGKYVLPGLIDAHTHIESPFAGCTGVLDFYTGSIAAAFGGVTTVIDFSNAATGKPLIDSVQARREEMAKAAIDYSMHVEIIEAGQERLAEIRKLVEHGFTSFKLYMTYKKEGIMVSDEELLKVFDEAGKWGGLPGVHAESDPIAEFNIERFRAAGTLGWSKFAEAKPDLCEKEAVDRAILYARYTKTPLYIFHLTNTEALKSVGVARAEGQPVYTETCPHYLALTREKYNGADGHLYIMSPPLREEADRLALWEGLADGTIEVVSSDNCTFTVEEKEKFLDRDSKGNIVPDFTKVINGVTGLEERLPLLMEEGVNRGRITINKLCEVAAYNPARIFGMYPQKGTIAKGSDADFVLIDPELIREISYRNLHHNISYSIYEGKSVKGWPVMTISRGRVLVEDGEFTGQRGMGNLVFRKSCL